MDITHKYIDQKTYNTLELCHLLFSMGIVRSWSICKTLFFNLEIFRGNLYVLFPDISTQFPFDIPLQLNVFVFKLFAHVYTAIVMFV